MCQSAVDLVLYCFSHRVDQHSKCSSEYLNQTQGRAARPENLDAEVGGFTALHSFFILKKKKDFPVSFMSC